MPRLFHAGPLHHLLADGPGDARVLVTRLVAPLIPPEGGLDAPDRSPLAVAQDIAARRARMSHPAIPQISSIRPGPAGSAEWVEPMPQGVTVADLIGATGPLPPAIAAPLLHAVAGALQAMRSAGLRMLTLLPERVVIGLDGSVTLVGVGLVEALRNIAPELRFPGARWEHLMPVPALTPPELLRNDALDHGADVFALAALAFLCLTGELPYSGTALTVWRASQRGQPQDANALCPSLGTAVSEALRQGLRPHAFERQESPAALVEALIGTAQEPPPLSQALDLVRGQLQAGWWDARHPTIAFSDQPDKDDPAQRLRTAEAVLEQLHYAVRERRGQHRSRRTEIMILIALAVLLLLPLLLFR